MRAIFKSNTYCHDGATVIFLSALHLLLCPGLRGGVNATFALSEIPFFSFRRLHSPLFVLLIYALPKPVSKGHIWQMQIVFWAHVCKCKWSMWIIGLRWWLPLVRGVVWVNPCRPSPPHCLSNHVQHTRMPCYFVSCFWYSVYKLFKALHFYSSHIHCAVI